MMREYQNTETVKGCSAPRGDALSSCRRLFRILCEAHLVQWAYVRRGMGVGLMMDEIALADPDIARSAGVQRAGADVGARPPRGARIPPCAGGVRHACRGAQPSAGASRTSNLMRRSARSLNATDLEMLGHAVA